MPSSKQTAHGLNLWEAQDHPLREDFVRDNQTVDDWLSKHIADTSLHKTPTDPAQLVCGTYTGDGGKLQTGFDPQAVLVFPFQKGLLQKDSSGNLVLYGGIAAVGLYCGPLYVLKNKGFSVKNDTAGTAVYALLNEKDSKYCYVAFR